MTDKQTYSHVALSINSSSKPILLMLDAWVRVASLSGLLHHSYWLLSVACAVHNVMHYLSVCKKESWRVRKTGKQGEGEIYIKLV